MFKLNTTKPAPTTISPERLNQLLQSVREKKYSQSQVTSSFSSPISNEVVSQGYGKHGELITYNTEQQQFISKVLSGESCVLTGAAGTGKTTCVMGAINSLIHSNKIPIMQECNHKYLPQSQVPGIIAVSYTRRAVTNLKKAMPAGLTGNCLTIHKLLEYEPVYYTTTDPVTLEEKKTMRFEPTRNQYNPLPEEIEVVIIDETSMVSTELFQQLLIAFSHPVQFIYIGDIQQLPPIFGPSIFGFKMLEHPVIELTQVYRQALESPIIELATKIKSGKTLLLKKENDTHSKETQKGKLTIRPWKKQISSDAALLTFRRFITLAYDSGEYNPENDCILIPFNKAFGTIEVNKYIAQHIAKKFSREVWEIIAGFNKLYFSIGDLVLYDKEEAVIINIEKNKTYLGKQPQKESKTLDYWGYNPILSQIKQIPENLDSTVIDTMLDSLAASIENEDRVKVASHSVTVKMIDSGKEVILDTASDLNSLLLSYAITVHKAQGSEWDKVFLVLHKSHNTMIQRELLYTAVTRAAKELYIICETDTFVKGVQSQKIKGNTIAEKAEWFKGKLESGAVPAEK